MENGWIGLSCWMVILPDETAGMPNYRRKPCRFTNNLNKDDHAKRVHDPFTINVQHTECL